MKKMFGQCRALIRGERLQLSNNWPRCPENQRAGSPGRAPATAPEHDGLSCSEDDASDGDDDEDAGEGDEDKHLI